VRLEGSSLVLIPSVALDLHYDQDRRGYGGLRGIGSIAGR
jgi:hypothetical protein